MAENQTIIIKRIKKGGHGHHGGAWKVAYADFVTAMMCFFLVMWLMGADEETKAAIAHYFNHPNSPYQNGQDPKSNSTHPMGESEGEGDSVMNGLNGLYPEDLIVERPLRELRDQLKENKVLSQMIEDVLTGEAYGLEVRENLIKFSLPDLVLFNPNTSDLTRESMQRLERLAQVFKGFDGTVTIEGHTDSAPPPPGSRYPNNWELSLARAVAVMNYFVDKHHIPADRFLPLGAEARHQIAPDTDSEGRAKNRRVEFILTRPTPKASKEPAQERKS